MQPESRTTCLERTKETHKKEPVGMHKFQLLIRFLKKKISFKEELAYQVPKC